MSQSCAFDLAPHVVKIFGKFHFGAIMSSTKDKTMRQDNLDDKDIHLLLEMWADDRV